MTSERHSFATQPGGRLEIVCDNGGVTIRGRRTNTVEVTAELRHAQAIEFHATGDGTNVRVEARARRGFGMFFPWDFPRCELEVSIPPGMKLDVRATNATIDVEAVTGDANLATTNGRVVTRRTNRAQGIASQNGAIVIDDHEGRVRARTQNGSVTADGVLGAVELSTINGKIHVEFEPPRGSESAIETTNGSVEAGIAGDAPVALDARTVHGAIQTPSRTIDHAAQPAQLRIRTVNGSVKVHAAELSRAPVYI